MEKSQNRLKSDEFGQISGKLVKKDIRFNGLWQEINDKLSILGNIQPINREVRTLLSTIYEHNLPDNM